MSLQLAAQHMASRGRGPDTTLVHMAPQEVAGLQALAKAHGGSLTINPDTGLPEAGFLSSILPLIAGAFLGPAGLGLTAMQAGLAAGALGTVATGSLKKGLMAGLGAFGGAGLAGSVMGAGAGAAQQAAIAGVDPTAGLAGLDAGMGAMPVGNIGTQTLGAGAETIGAAAQTGASGMQPLAGVPGKFVTGALPSAPASSMVAPPNVVQSIAEQVPTSTAMPELSRQGMLNEAAARVTPGTELYKAAGTSPFDTVKAGFGELAKDPSKFMTKENLQYGLAGLAPMMIQDPQQMEKRPAEATPRYSYDPGRISDPYANRSGAYTGEVLHFDPRFTRLAAGGGLMDIGPVQAMSDRNEAQTLMANQGQMFAEGGETKAVKPVEQDPYYTMSGQSGDAFKYLMGQMPARAPAPAPVAAAPVVQPAVQPVAAQPTSAMGGLRGLLAESSTGAIMRPYTFDPATGTFTALPVVNADFEAAPAPTPTLDSGSYYAQGGIASMAQGGQSHLGDYSDGGRLLKGPGDGVSDSIPATIADKRPARLADGEFVVPARIVSELGNGSTEAGARKLYAMMDRVQNARKKSIGKDRVAVNSRAEKLLPV